MSISYLGESQEDTEEYMHLEPMTLPAHMTEVPVDEAIIINKLSSSKKHDIPNSNRSRSLRIPKFQTINSPLSSQSANETLNMNDIEFIVRARTIIEDHLNNGKNHDETVFQKASWFDRKTEGLRTLMKQVITNKNSIASLNKYITNFNTKIKHIFSDVLVDTTGGLIIHKEHDFIRENKEAII